MRDRADVEAVQCSLEQSFRINQKMTGGWNEWSKGAYVVDMDVGSR